MSDRHESLLSVGEEVMDAVYDFRIKAVASVIFAPAARHGSFGCGVDLRPKYG